MIGFSVAGLLSSPMSGILDICKNFEYQTKVPGRGLYEIKKILLVRFFGKHQIKT